MVMSPITDIPLINQEQPMVDSTQQVNNEQIINEEPDLEKTMVMSPITDIPLINQEQPMVDSTQQVNNEQIINEEPDLEKTMVMSPVADIPLINQELTGLDSMTQTDAVQPVMEQPIVSEEPNIGLTPVMPEVPQTIDVPQTDIVQPVMEQPVVSEEPNIGLTPVMPEVSQTVDTPQTDMVQPVMEQPVVSEDPNIGLTPIMPEVPQTVDVPQTDMVQPVMEQPVINQDASSIMVPPVVVGVGTDANPDLLTSALDSSQIPQIDSSIPVAVPDFMQVQQAIEEQQSIEASAAPDLLSSQTVLPTPELITPIPMDNNPLPSVNMQNESYQQSINNNLQDDRLFKAFVGQKYYEVGRHRFFNIWGFLFGGLYLIYRKMYLLGIAVLVIQNLLSNVLHQLLVFLILGGVIGLFFNIIYTMYVNMKISSIKKHYNNNLENICSIKGGTSFGNTILCIILYIVVISVLTVALGIKTIANDILDTFQINFKNFGMVGSVTDEYNGHVEYYIGKFKVFMHNTDPAEGEEPEISDKELLKVVMPRAKQDSDYVSCTLDNRAQGWHNTTGYLFKPGSTDCKNYMENAEAYITGDMYPLPDSAILIFNSKKELGPGTRLDYKDSSCMYNQEKEKFECRKR